MKIAKLILTTCVASGVAQAELVAKTSGTGIFVAEEGMQFLADPKAVLPDNDNNNNNEQYGDFISETRRMLQYSAMNAADLYRYGEGQMNLSFAAMNATNISCSATSKVAQAAWQSVKKLTELKCWFDGAWDDGTFNP